MKTTCPCCDSSDTAHSLTTPPMPVASALLLRSAEASRALPRRVLQLWHCRACDFLWNLAFDPALVRYDTDYEGTQSHSPHFTRYLSALAGCWLADLDPPPEHILEVGCGQGEFLNVLAGLTPARLTGYDPAARAPIHGRLRIVAESLPAPADDRANFVFSRMTLEHVVDPAAFIAAKLAWLAPGGVLAAQVPDAATTVRAALPCDFQYEHANYFCARSLAALFTRSGLVVGACASDYAGQHLAAFGRRGPSTETNASAVSPTTDFAPALDHLVEVQRRFGALWHLRLAARHGAGDEIWLWGAGSRATAFCANLPDLALVKGAIDVNPNRAGTYVPGTTLATVEPSHLRGCKRLFILIMNPIYRSEIADMVASIGTSAEFASLDEEP